MQEKAGIEILPAFFCGLGTAPETGTEARSTKTALPTFWF